jgi:hypothetical protein
VVDPILLGVLLIDLRLACNKGEDFANPIEPSESGSSKIAAAIVQTGNESQLFAAAQHKRLGPQDCCRRDGGGR